MPAIPTFTRSAIYRALTAISSGGAGQLLPGHYINQKMTLVFTSIRPDSETGSFAATLAPYRYAYYDGVNNIPYQYPVVTIGGSWPIRWSVTGPSWLTIGNTYGAADYGVLSGTPTAAISTGAPATVVVTATGQDGISQTMTFTLATSSSTSQFMFADTAGNSGNSGAIGSPKTLVSVMGTSDSVATFPGRQIIMRGGSYAFTAHTQFAGACGLDNTLHPVVYKCYPGETVTISCTNAEIYDSTSFTDLCFMGSLTSRMIINGSSTLNGEAHTFWSNNSSRCTWAWIDFTNQVSKVNGTQTNSTNIFSSITTPNKNYFSIHNCTETGRTTNGNNDMVLFCLFSTDYIGVQFCSTTSTAQFGPFFKDTNNFVSCRANVFKNTVQGGNGLLFGTQHGGANLEGCYNYVSDGALKFDFQAEPTAGQQWSYRNTIYRTDTNEIYGILTNGGVGPYSSESDVIVAKGNTVVGPSITTSGTEAHYAWNGQSPPGTGAPINTSTGNLINVSAGTQFRTLYLYTRGWEIG